MPFYVRNLSTQGFWCHRGWRGLGTNSPWIPRDNCIEKWIIMLTLTLHYLQLLCFCDSWLTCSHFRAVHVHLGYLQKQMRPWWLLWSELIFIMMVWFCEAHMWAAGQQQEKYNLEEQTLKKKKKKRSTILKENYLPHQLPGFWVGWKVEMALPWSQWSTNALLFDCQTLLKFILL